MSASPDDHRPWGLVAGLATAALGVVLAVVAGRSALPPSPPGEVVAAQLIAGLSFALVGMVVWWRHRARAVGLLAIAVAVAIAAPQLRWIETSATWTVGWMLVDAHLILLAWLILAFPSGRLTRTATVFVAVAVGYFVALAVAGHLFQDPWPGCDSCPANLALVRLDPSLNDRIWDLGQIGNLAVLGGFVAIALTERQRGSPAARRALSPVTWALAPIALTLVFVFLEPVVGFGSSGARAVLVAERLALAVFPLALLVGLVRGRLDRARVADLAKAIDDETDPVVLDSLVRRSLGDPDAQLVFRSAATGEQIDATGRVVGERNGAATAVIRSETGDELGAIVHDPALDRSLVDAVAATVALAVRNESLRADLRRQLHEVTVSRQRLAEATVTERRRVERDLHDGAQQGLLALAASLSSIRLGADGQLADRLEGAIDDLQAIIEELRDLARGVHPPVLAERGLIPALEALAERSSIPVKVDGAAPRCRPTAEAAAYFLVAEALANAVRHADASQVTVTVGVVDDLLTVTVCDDGTGGAAAGAGTGLEGLTDRLEALGGHLQVTSPRGGGTTVRGTIPCE